MRLRRSSFLPAPAFRRSAFLLLLVPLLAPAAHPPVNPLPAFGQFPAYFEANRGQADARFQFIARGRHHGVYLAPNEAVLALADSATDETRFLSLSLLGANERAACEGQDRFPGSVNYFLGNNPAAWQSDVPTFAQVRFNAVYPGIDLIYHNNERQLEFDFIVAPGADPAAIALRFNGADRLRLGAQGEIILETAGAQILQHRPHLYQTIAGARHDIAGRYQLRDERTAIFVVGSYDTHHPLIIDPVISYSTFLGGSKGESGWAIAVDGAGSAYVAGETLSVFKDIPPSGFQTNFTGGNRHGGDAFVAKLNPAGTAFDYLTYLGGNKLDGAIGLAIDNAGNAYVAGYTDSADFPVTPGVLQPKIAGAKVPRTSAAPSDAFITKLNPSGTALVYSTYLGGDSFDSAISIAVDADGAAYVVGATESAALYRTTNRVCATLCTNSACGPTTCKTNITKSGEFYFASISTNFVRLTITGSNPPVTNLVEQIVMTTLLGVQTLNPGFPITNALQVFHGATHDSPNDLFIAKINPDASALVYSTYLGGSGRDFGTGIAVDAAGNATVTGWTESLDFPVTPNAFQPLPGGRIDAFVSKLDPAGASLIYSTYLGGSGNDVAFRVALDAAGCAYVTGAESSGDFPATPAGINHGGVFKSVDAGGSWQSSGAGLTHTLVEALALDPTNSSVLYAGTPRGVFRTSDAGMSWLLRVSGLHNTTVHSLAFNTAGTTLYAGTAGGVYTSTNAGSDWSFSAAGLSSRAVFALAVAPGTPPTTLAGTRGSGVFRSTNDALSWKSANSGLRNLNVNALAVNPADAQIIYAATDGGVYKSTNNGVSWRGSSAGLITKRSQALAIDPLAPNTLYVGTVKGLFKSINAGMNWTRLPADFGYSNITALALTSMPGIEQRPFAQNPPIPVLSMLYAGTTNGLFKSTDGGTTWTTNSSGLAPSYVKTLLLDPATPSTLYTGIRSVNTFGGSNDVFLTKFLPDGSGLAYSITFGGKKADQGWGVAVDASGRAFVTGSTDSANFPVVNPTTSQQSTNSGRTDVFLAEIDADGGTLLFSIYLGGKKRDLGYALALDAAGAVYITGRTESSGFPTNTAPQAELAGKNDAFILKVIPEVALRLDRGAGHMIVSWPGPMPGFVLEGAETMNGPWSQVAQSPVFKSGRTSVTLPSASAARFFRLKSAAP